MGEINDHNDGREVGSKSYSLIAGCIILVIEGRDGKERAMIGMRGS